ncbi:hypothetical protein [Deinococcus sp. PEB2-63]
MTHVSAASESRGAVLRNANYDTPTTIHGIPLPMVVAGVGAVGVALMAPILIPAIILFALAFSVPVTTPPQRLASTVAMGMMSLLASVAVAALSGQTCAISALAAPLYLAASLILMRR